MKTAIVKRSIILEGHKTSVSLEDEFWEGLRELAERNRTNVSALVRQIDHERKNGNLSSAIRVYVFNLFRARANATTGQAVAPEPPRPVLQAQA